MIGCIGHCVESYPSRLLMGMFVLVGVSLIGCNGEVESIETILQKATMLNDRERFDEALALLDDAVGADGGNADVFYLRGVARENLQQLDRAVEAYSQCLEIDPRSSDALNNRGVIHGRMGNLDLAIADLTTAVELNPDDAVARSNLGLAYHEMGDFDSAVSSYDEAARRSKNPQILYQRGNSRLATGEFQKAIEDYSEAIKNDSMYARAYLNRAIAHLRSGDSAAAAADLDRAEQYDSDMTITPLAHNLREVLDQRSLRTKAVDSVREWLEQSGWEATTDDNTPFDFVASRLPTPAESEVDSQSAGVPDQFHAVVLVHEPDVGIVSSFVTINAAMEVTRTHENETAPGVAARLCLFVVDSTELKTQNVDPTTGQPFWLLFADYDWRPTKSDFEPYQVRMQLPEGIQQP